MTTIETAIKATRYYRDTRGWCGETIVALPGYEKKQLVLNTRKHTSSPVLTTDASVRTNEGRGCWSFAIGFGGEGDYMKRVILTSPKRVTEKAVRQQHERALIMLNGITQDAVAHYARQRKTEQQALPLAA